ncbi:hypothetical protein Q9L58_010432 [Maublancomyces gigas]|uniref:Uncharacterized protein n=1 Tax=Discina gigas TaxID=1032678 RepID=A0ABR3G444_9PEZI
MPRNASGAMARLRWELTRFDKNPLQDAPIGVCNGQPSSAGQILLDCPIWSAERANLTEKSTGPTTCDNITYDEIEPRELLTFLNAVGIIKARKIITAYEDTRNADYELEADI